jgi:hypothetical protein
MALAADRFAGALEIARSGTISRPPALSNLAR